MRNVGGGLSGVPGGHQVGPPPRPPQSAFNGPPPPMGSRGGPSSSGLSLSSEYGRPAAHPQRVTGPPLVQGAPPQQGQATNQSLHNQNIPNNQSPNLPGTSSPTGEGSSGGAVGPTSASVPMSATLTKPLKGKTDPTNIPRPCTLR
eukprot:Selendium_serpulae@DN7750_c0_g1_i1.p2